MPPLYVAVTQPDAWNELTGRLPAEAARLTGMEEGLQQEQTSF